MKRLLIKTLYSSRCFHSRIIFNRLESKYGVYENSLKAQLYVIALHGSWARVRALHDKRKKKESVLVIVLKEKRGMRGISVILLLAEVLSLRMFSTTDYSSMNYHNIVHNTLRSFFTVLYMSSESLSALLCGH